VIAAVQGGCIGGGVDFVAACCLRYATRDAWFVIQEINLGMMADVGTLNWQLRGTLEGLDAAPLGRLIDGFEKSRDAGDPSLAFALVEEELKALLAGGLAATIEQFDVTLPQGTLAARLELDVAATDRDDFVWTGMLLATECSANVAIHAALFEFVVERNPDARALLAAGFIVRKGDDYELVAEYRQGLLTINGAPMPLPMPSM